MSPTPRRRMFVVLAAAALLGLLAGGAAHAASFDCAKASTVDERAVCSDPRLSELDSLVGRAFSQAKASSSDKEDASRTIAIAHVFMARRHGCGAARGCLIGAYVGAIDGYTSEGSTVAVPDWVDAPAMAGGQAPRSRTVPGQLGRCVSTEVDSVTPRLDSGQKPTSEDYNSGTAINFTNEGHQVSYEREPKLLASRKGDPVVMCLISIPQHCPPGDDRGRGYTVTNLRTHQTWTMGDSQHMCGGA